MEKQFWKKVTAVVNTRRRIQLLLAFLALVTVLLIGRVAYLQLFNGGYLSSYAEQNQTKLIPGEDIYRGNILDRKGHSLTDSKVESALIVFPDMLDDRDKTADDLGEILGIAPRAVSAMLNKNYVYFPGLSGKQMEAVQELGIYGVSPVKIKVRFGTGSLARHVVGHVNSIDSDTWAMINQQNEDSLKKEYSLDDVIGVKGIEAEYEDYLHASDPEFFLSAVMDARGNVIPGLSFDRVYSDGSAVNRNNIYLTIDKELQKKVEEVMDNHIEKGAVVVMEVATGDILAAASRPNYNQNIIADSIVSGDKSFNNRAFEFYHPGSVFKILIASAALEEGAVNPNELFLCTGKFTLSTGLTINCWNKEGHGPVNFVEGFAHSCNPVFIDVALRLGREKILEYGKRFGLSKAEIIGYPTPTVKCLDIDPFGEGKIANAALGQEGVRISPLQVAGMVSVIASGGCYRTPRLVSQITDSEGKVLEAFEPGEKLQVISSAVAEQVKEMLGQAVLNGTGKEAWIAEFGSGGKTGSAETGKKGADGKSITNVWFAGFAPLENPRFAIAVLKEEGDSGSKDAAPVFKEIAEFALKNL